MRFAGNLFGCRPLHVQRQPVLRRGVIPSLGAAATTGPRERTGCPVPSSFFQFRLSGPQPSAVSLRWAPCGHREDLAIGRGFGQFRLLVGAGKSTSCSGTPSAQLPVPIPTHRSGFLRPDRSGNRAPVGETVTVDRIFASHTHPGLPQSASNRNWTALPLRSEPRTSGLLPRVLLNESACSLAGPVG